MEHKRNFTHWSHEPPREPFNLFVWLASALLICGGVHPETARRVCSPAEVLDIMILGLVLLGASCMTASTVTTVLHFSVGDGQFHPLYVLVGCMVGAMQGATDNVLQYRAKFEELGFLALSRSGYKLPETIRRGSGNTTVTVVRLLQALAIGMIAGLAIILVALKPSIDAFEIAKYRTDNPIIYVQGEKQVDAEIKRTADDLTASTKRLEQINHLLATLRQDGVNRSVGLRARNVTATNAASDAQTTKLDASVAAETAIHDSLKDTLKKQSANREADIARKVAASPNAVPKLAGLSGQLEALSALMKDDFKLLVFVIALQIISTALELSPMWISLRFFPSSYASHISFQRFIDAKVIGERGATALGETSPAELPEMAEHAASIVADPPLVDQAGQAPPETSIDDAAPSSESTQDHHPEVEGEPAPSQPSIAEALGLQPRRPRRGDTKSNGGDHGSVQ